MPLDKGVPALLVLSHAPGGARALEDWHWIRIVITFASATAGTKLHPAHLQFVIN